MFSVVLTTLSMIAISKTEESGVYFQIEEESSILIEDSIWTGEVDSLLSCSQMCGRQAFCKSANYITEGGKCSLHRETKKMYPNRFLQQQGHENIQGQPYPLLPPRKVSASYATFYI